MRNALNALLYQVCTRARARGPTTAYAALSYCYYPTDACPPPQTGTESNSFMLVLSTNFADALDAAVLDRVDDQLWSACALAERRRLAGPL